MRLRVALHLSVALALAAGLLLCLNAGSAAQHPEQSIGPVVGDHLERRYQRLLSDRLAQQVSNSALAQASQALSKAAAMRKAGDVKGAARRRLVADAAITLASRQRAKAQLEANLVAAKRRLRALQERVAQ